MKILRVIPAVVIIAVMLLTGCSGKTEKIVFYTHLGINTPSLFSMNPDGSNLTRLTPWNVTKMPYHNIWSADGKTMAFFNFEYGVPESWIGVMNTDGTGKRKLLDTTDLSIESLALSPDGTRIIVSIASTRISRIETPKGSTVHVEIIKNSDNDLFVIDVASGELTRLTDTPDIAETRPVYSPDGKQIICLAKVDPTDLRITKSYVCLMNADAGNQQLLAEHDRFWFDGYPDFRWSPDGKKVAYYLYTNSISDCHHFCDVLIFDLETETLTNLTDSPLINDVEPAWSPDGTKLAYNSGTTEGGYRVMIYDLETGTTVATNIGESSPSWTPDGKGFIFINRKNVSQLMRSNADGTDVSLMADTVNYTISMPYWIIN